MVRAGMLRISWFVLAGCANDALPTTSRRTRAPARNRARLAESRFSHDRNTEPNPTLHRPARMRPRSSMAAFQRDYGNGTCHLSGFQNQRISWFRNERVVKTYTGAAASNRDRLDARLGGCCRNDRWPPVLGSGYRFHPAGFPRTDL